MQLFPMFLLQTSFCMFPREANPHNLKTDFFFLAMFNGLIRNNSHIGDLKLP